MLDLFLPLFGAEWLGGSGERGVILTQMSDGNECCELLPSGRQEDGRKILQGRDVTMV